MQTIIEKNRDGKWTAETVVELPELPPRNDEGIERRAALVISSAVGRGCVSLQACVMWLAPASRLFTIFEDFSKCYAPIPAARVTESTMKAAHEKGLEQLEAMKAAALAHYQGKGA